MMRNKTKRNENDEEANKQQQQQQHNHHNDDYGAQTNFWPRTLRLIGE